MAFVVNDGMNARVIIRGITTTRLCNTKLLPKIEFYSTCRIAFIGDGYLSYENIFFIMDRINKVKRHPELKVLGVDIARTRRLCIAYLNRP